MALSQIHYIGNLGYVRGDVQGSNVEREDRKEVLKNKATLR